MSATPSQLAQRPPEKLYKFRKVETPEDWERLAAILEKRELYSSSPQQFNDPFDCRVPPLRSVDPAFARYLISPADPSNATGKLSRDERSQLQKVFEKAQHKIDAGGVIALGAARDSILMWSHYANNHRGIALEFDTANWIKDMFAIKGQFFPVTYSKKRLPIKLSRAQYDSEQLFQATILTKDRCWKSEEEWRIVTPACGPLPFPPSALTGVIFRCRASGDTKSKLRKIYGSLSGITFYQASMKPRAFGLKFAPC